MPIHFTYKAGKQASHLFSVYQTIRKDAPHLTDAQLMTGIRLLAENIGRIFNSFEDPIHAKELVLSTVQEETKEESILSAIDSYPLKELKKNEAEMSSQSSLISQLGLIGQRSPSVAASLEQQSESRQIVVEAAFLLKDFFRQNKVCYIKHFPAGILPSVAEERERILLDLMPKIARILRAHAFSISSDVNTAIIKAAIAHQRKKEEELSKTAAFQ